jgi:hypothetical protein
MVEPLTNWLTGWYLDFYDVRKNCNSFIVFSRKVCYNERFTARLATIIQTNKSMNSIIK